MWCSVWIKQNFIFTINYDMCTPHFIDFVFCLVIFFLLIATMYILLIGTMNYWKKKKNPHILLIGTTYIFELQKLINV